LQIVEKWKIRKGNDTTLFGGVTFFSVYICTCYDVVTIMESGESSFNFTFSIAKLSLLGRIGRCV